MAVNDDVWDLRHPGEAMRMPLAIPVFEPLPTQVMALAALLILAASVGASAQVEEARELAGILELVAKALETLVEDGCIVIMNEAGPVVAVRRLHSRYKPALVQSYMRKEPAL